ncbi:MAG: ATP-dependent sacrificial sulfur transferase LarE [Methanocalculus sp. MSAO_Arc1]|uniref:ATP-dependent sacrificial sulfur transferase LarE n=1 Tax=Methanocalculus TaxID=71151 RepID=UPI000FED6650|nr:MULTISPECIES: ATP-dependent sacrificial sulfur transferase LarE [unclassified Methanocalculus]MCP1661360.1 uncharacterized protein [Methanocalculus sp. AMF5]RQD79652.1 MAG: ATP-dependent sacrificial sulfur transferase LarE [Methanocalculus sp. MSAO_Arc1]
MNDQIQKLQAVLRAKAPLIISFSGGVDSSVLAAIAARTIPGMARFALLDSPLLSRHAYADALLIAEEIGIDLEIVPFPILEDKQFCENPFDRCALCKQASSRILKELAEGAVVADGANLSDRGEYRPGLAVADAEGIIHPFIEAGIDKNGVRELARNCGYSFWNKPSDACLATRIPYWNRVLPETLLGAEAGEAVLRKFGVSQCRLRAHGDSARIEVHPDEFPIVLARRQEIVKIVRELGFCYVTLDLEGFRSGSMDGGK